MNKYSITAILAIASLSLGTAALADNLSKEEYKDAKKQISAEYKAAIKKCNPMAGNAKDICKEDAKGTKNIRNAEVAARYEPSRKATYNVTVAKAAAVYAVAKEKCDDEAGNAKDVCVEKAKAVWVSAKAGAEEQLKTSTADREARDDSNAAQMKAKEKAEEAHADATADKRDANYAVAKEKCDALSGAAKTSCINEAKVHYGK